MPGYWETKPTTEGDTFLEYVGERFGATYRVNPYLRCFSLCNVCNRYLVKVLVGAISEELNNFIAGAEWREVKKDNTFVFYGKSFTLTPKEVKLVETLRSEIPEKKKPKKLTREERLQSRIDYYKRIIDNANSKISKYQEEKERAERSIRFLEGKLKGGW